MSNETKRDVFNKLSAAYLEDEKRLDKLVNEPDEHIPELDFMYFNKSYDAALPDDLPIIPLAVSEEIKGSHDSLSLRDELESVDSTSDDFSVVDYIENSESVFAEAWSRGLWIVAETGEIVRL